MLCQTLSHTLKLAPHERPSTQPLTKNPQQLCYFLCQTLTKDPQQVWQTLKNFDYPEFVIMLNTTDDQLIQKIIKSAKKNFVTENEKNDKPYQLSASMGYAITNLSNETIDDFMNRIDEQMYQDKMKYYEHNARRNSK